MKDIKVWGRSPWGWCPLNQIMDPPLNQVMDPPLNQVMDPPLRTWLWAVVMLCFSSPSCRVTTCSTPERLILYDVSS